MDNTMNEDSKKLQEANLFKAIEAGDTDSVRKLIQAGVNLASQNDRGKTPLRSAVSAYFESLNIGKYDNQILPFSHENQNHQDIIVLIQQHLRKTDVSQFIIIQKFMRFLSIIYKNNPPQFEARLLKNLFSIQNGACNGFSAILSDLASQGKASRFLDDLNIISNWDGEKDSLMKSDSLFETIRTMYDNSVFLSFIQSKFSLEYSVHNEKMDLPRKEDGKEVTQKDWDHLTSLISDRPVNRKKEFEAVFSYQSNELVDAINKIALEGKSIRFSFKHHTMTLFKENGQFMFYDPNSSAMARFVDTAEEVVKQVETAYTLFEKNKEVKPDSLMEVEMQVFNFNDSPPGNYPDLTNLINGYITNRADSFSINQLNFSSIAKTNALGTAVFLDSLESVEALLSAGADPNLAVLSLMNLPVQNPNQLSIFMALLDKGLDPTLAVPTWDGKLIPFYEQIEYNLPHLSKMLKNRASGHDNSLSLTPGEALYKADSILFSKALDQAFNEGKLSNNDMIKLQKTLTIIIDIHKNQYQPSETILSEYKKIDAILGNSRKVLTNTSESTYSKLYLPLQKETKPEKFLANNSKSEAQLTTAAQITKPDKPKSF